MLVFSRSPVAAAPWPSSPVPRAAAQAPLPRSGHGSNGAARRALRAEVACFALAGRSSRRSSPWAPRRLRVGARIVRSRARATRGQGDQGPAKEDSVSSEDHEDRSDLPAESAAVKRLKDMVFLKGMKTAITSGEFALRLAGAERPGLVDYEGLCNLLDGYADRYRRDWAESSDAEDEDAWKASQDLRVIRGKLQERLVAMTKAQKLKDRGEDRPETLTQKVEKPPNREPAGEDDLPITATRKTKTLEAAVPSKFMLYLRADETVDIDTALQESQAEQPLSRDLWERLEGTTEHGADWMPDEEMTNEEAVKQMALFQAKRDLERAHAKRAKVLKRMTEEDGSNVAKLFGWDRQISGCRNLALLANVDLIFEKVALKLEKLLQQATLSDWDISGRSLKLLVYEFALLDKQVAPYRSYIQEDPQDERVRGLDLDELQMLETHSVRLARRVGLHVDRIHQSQGFFNLLRRQLVSWSSFWQKIRRGVVFQASGVRLLSQDLQHALRLVLKVLFLKHVLRRREANVCRRAVKDLLVLVPFLIILLIPLSPPGHMLVFSLILKVYPDFVPSPFTEHRQNVMRIYREIQPVR